MSAGRIAAVAVLLLALALPAGSARSQVDDDAELQRRQDEAAALLLAERAAEAEPLLRALVGDYRRRPEPQQQGLGAALLDLGIALRQLARYDESRSVIDEALARERAIFGDDSLQVAEALGVLAGLLGDIDRPAEALPLLEDALRIFELHHGGNEIRLGRALNDLGLAYLSLGRLDEAETLLERAVAVFEAGGGAAAGDLSAVLSNLSDVDLAAGRVEQAEARLLRSLELKEATHPEGSASAATTLNNLGLLYWDLGRIEDAERVHRAALAMRERLLGPLHPDVATSLNNLAVLIEGPERQPEAVELLTRALAIEEAALGKDSPALAGSLNNLAVAYLVMQQPAAAEPYAMRALALHQTHLGPDHADTVNARNTVAAMYADMGRPDLAVPMFERNIETLQRVQGVDSVDMTTDYSNLALTLLDEGRPRQALEPARAATALLRRRLVEAGFGGDRAALDHIRTKRGNMVPNLAVLAALQAERPGGRDATMAAEGFEVAQIIKGSSVAASLAAVAARFAAGDDELATLVRRQQDLLAEVQQLEDAQVRQLALPAAERDPQAVAVRAERQQVVRAELQDLREDVARRFPEYRDLMSQAPWSAERVQALLGGNEAMLVYVPARRYVFAFVLRSDRVELRQLPITGADLLPQLRLLRAKLVPGDGGRLPTLTPQTMLVLSDALVAPLLPALEGATRVYVVSDGPLQGLPFALLAERRDGGEHWLGRRFAFATLPAVSSLGALRRFQRDRPPTQSFVGFGDPVLAAATGATRQLGSADVYGDDSADTGLADVALLRQAPSLPDTALELRDLAVVLQASESALFLRERATEAEVKSADLTDVGLLAFATHGVTAGELGGVLEPGLILTPPDTASALDDGYLSASEVAALTLDADWVLLSACNTAAADGTPAAEGLSGLAKAFFHAGSRSLLVSNWPVSSEATRHLVTDTVRRHVAAPERGRPEALQAAMVAMMDEPRYAHPFYWAPFIVVGD